MTSAQTHARPSVEVREAQAGGLVLESAILVYRGSGNAFATVHDVSRDARGVATILPGKAMTPPAVARLAAQLGRDNTGGFVPQTLLYRDAAVMAWWVPPQRRKVWFRGTAESGIGERNAVVPLPGLVFAATMTRKWYVWAVTGNDRPQPTTALMRSSFFNVYDSGEICVGNVTLPAKTDAERIDAWNDAFFRSYFTHPNGSERLVNYAGGGVAFWKDMLDGRFTEFPEDVLASTEMSLERAMAKVRATSGR